MVSGHETDISEDLPAIQNLNMLTFRGAPSGKALEAWRDNFFLKVGVVRIRVLVSKKISERKRRGPGPGPPRFGPKSGPMGPNLGPDPTRITKITLRPLIFFVS